MGYGDDEDFGVCNLFIQFILFVTNFILVVKGGILLVIGIYAQVEAGALNDIGAGDILASPGIVLIIVGIVILLLGLFGCIGAVKEIFIVLVIYAIVLTAFVILEIGLAGYIVTQQDNARQRFSNRVENYIVRYYDNADLQNIVDLVQQSFDCCGANGPDDWQANIYFNCSSVAFQRCSVPFSCCIPPEGEDEVMNLQCGYRTLNSSNTDRFLKGIYTDGCVAALEGFVRQYFDYIAGIGGVVILIKILTIFLAILLALDVWFECKAQERQERKHKQQEEEHKEQLYTSSRESPEEIEKPNL